MSRGKSRIMAGMEIRLPGHFKGVSEYSRLQISRFGDNSPVYIAQEISYIKFRIAGGKPGMKISRQVTGIRKDDFALTNQIEVETDKPENERGKYLDPGAFDFTDELRIDIANNNPGKIQSSGMENNPGELEKINPGVRELMEFHDEKNQRTYK